MYYSECNSGDCVTKELFSDWQRRVLDLFDIDVPNEACPDWHIVKVQNIPEGWSFGNGLCLGYAWVGFIRFAVFHTLRYMIASYSSLCRSSHRLCV